MQKEIEALLNAWLGRQEQENVLVQGLLAALAQNELARHKMLHDLSDIAALAIKSAGGATSAHTSTEGAGVADQRVTQAVEAFREAQGISQRH